MSAREIERLRDRVAELEEALGLTAEIPRDIVPLEIRGVHRVGSPGIRRFIAMLLARPFGNREAIYNAFYGALPEVDQPGHRILDVYSSAARKVLKAHGIELQTIRHQGWFIDTADKTKLRATIARLNRDQQQAA